MNFPIWEIFQFTDRYTAVDNDTVKEKQSDEMTNEPADETNIVHQKVKFEVYGEEMLEKKVRASGNSGRIYLPPDWVGHRVKIVRID